MKRLLLGAFLLASSALAANTGPGNLVNRSFCFTPTSVQISDEAVKDQPQIRTVIFEAISTKLRAYRVPLANSCASELFLQVDAAVNGQGLLIYTLALDLFDAQLLPAPVSLWSAGAFGAVVRSGNNVTESLNRQIANAVDKFAADYATANP